MQIAGTEKFKKTFADVVKGSQATITKETEKCSKNNLGDALKESQSEIVSQTTAKQEADLFDKEKRVSNIVITGVAESELTEISVRVAAGPPLGKGSNSDWSTPRPLVVVLETPELARVQHKYGNGRRIIHDGTELWINPDLTKAERKANYNAGQLEKHRRKTPKKL